MSSSHHSSRSRGFSSGRSSAGLTTLSTVHPNDSISMVSDRRSHVSSRSHASGSRASSARGSELWDLSGSVPKRVHASGSHVSGSRASGSLASGSRASGSRASMSRSLASGSHFSDSRSRHSGLSDYGSTHSGSTVRPYSSSSRAMVPYESHGRDTSVASYPSHASSSRSRRGNSELLGRVSSEPIARGLMEGMGDVARNGGRAHLECHMLDHGRRTGESMVLDVNSTGAGRPSMGPAPPMYGWGCDSDSDSDDGFSYGGSRSHYRPYGPYPF
ncbi:hypothetical protein K491DRAFT_690396 [Lophiostoma macrostomum CBS 122681]|uniref:Uncharacterized protein n=1 Tax=Lophiostoma macrostomum CBS 122681 TaxID=1314788 RepID=A0A6A6TEB0_9PLEO|nr:hypothetical protein K491DRAFT_690396 [Lophiostoma macrostomum CBS 122681]